MRVDFTCVKFCSEEFVVCEGSGGTTRKTERGRDEGRASNGGHLECPKAAIVSVYALLAHTSPYTGRKTYNRLPSRFQRVIRRSRNAYVYTLGRPTRTTSRCLIFPLRHCFVSLMPGDNHRWFVIFRRLLECFNNA